MNASKEEAKKAKEELWKLALALDALGDKLGCRKDVTDPLKRHILRVKDFVEAAERKLPTEVVYDKDVTRRKARK